MTVCFISAAAMIVCAIGAAFDAIYASKFNKYDGCAAAPTSTNDVIYYGTELSRGLLALCMYVYDVQFSGGSSTTVLPTIPPTKNTLGATNPYATKGTCFCVNSLDVNADSLVCGEFMLSKLSLSVKGRDCGEILTFYRTDLTISAVLCGICTLSTTILWMTTVASLCWVHEVIDDDDEEEEGNKGSQKELMASLKKGSSLKGVMSSKGGY